MTVLCQIGCLRRIPVAELSIRCTERWRGWRRWSSNLRATKLFEASKNTFLAEFRRFASCGFHLVLRCGVLSRFLVRIAVRRLPAARRRLADPPTSGLRRCGALADEKNNAQDRDEADSSTHSGFLPETSAGRVNHFPRPRKRAGARPAPANSSWDSLVIPGQPGTQIDRSTLRGLDSDLREVKTWVAGPSLAEAEILKAEPG